MHVNQHADFGLQLMVAGSGIIGIVSVLLLWLCLEAVERNGREIEKLNIVLTRWLVRGGADDDRTDGPVV